MITQYPWVSVKQQERKYLEIGTMITLLVAIISFYSVPQFQSSVTIEESYIAPAIEVIKIPATVQPPERVAPLLPKLPIPSAKDDVLEALPDDLIFSFADFQYLEKPDEPDMPIVPFWAVEVKPEPLGGWDEIKRNVIYPSIAIEARQEGKIVVEALIGINGVVKEATILIGLAGTGLDEAALAAVLKTPFSPAYQRDKPVQVKVAIPIEFRLK